MSAMPLLGQKKHRNYIYIASSTLVCSSVPQASVGSRRKERRKEEEKRRRNRSKNTTKMRKNFSLVVMLFNINNICCYESTWWGPSIPEPQPNPTRTGSMMRQREMHARSTSKSCKRFFPFSYPFFPFEFLRHYQRVCNMRPAAIGRLFRLSYNVPPVFQIKDAHR